VHGNDSQLVFTNLLNACSGTREASVRRVIELLVAVRGPYALVFYDASHKRIYYGRDCLGRRSLLQQSTSDGTLVLSSVCDNASGESWAEVEADGIYMVDVELPVPTSSSLPVTKVPHQRFGQEEDPGTSFVGRSAGTRVLLTDLDSAISYHEFHCRHQLCITGHWCNRAAKGVAGKITSASHPAYTRGSDWCYEARSSERRTSGHSFLWWPRLHNPRAHVS
jgi:hypothetical protein